MNDLDASKQKPNRRMLRHASFLCAAILACSVLATTRSYMRSDSLTLLDATICTDEGLLSLQIPLVRRAPSEQSTTQWTIYSRGKNIWDDNEGGGKATLRSWMSMADQVGCEGGMVGGFGYWKGAWQSNSRPGPFLVMFTPIWAVVSVAFTLVATFYLRRVQFRLATILLLMTGVSVVLWLLTLRAAT